MATIDYEKKYKEALEKARQLCAYPTTKSFISDLQDLFPELAESEDEKIRKYILKCCKETIEANDRGLELSMDTTKKLKNWLEKQGEYANFLDKIQIGDKVTRNEDGVLVNLSQLQRVEKKDEKQARQIERIVHNDGCTQKLQEQIADWFKSLKERVQPQPRQGWSEEDENHVKSILSTIECCKAQFPNAQAVVEAYNADIEWLKSLKPKSQWKPSDLPHWKKSTLPNDNTTGFNSDYFCHNGYNINYKELFEKLPKDD